MNFDSFNLGPKSWNVNVTVETIVITTEKDNSTREEEGSCIVHLAGEDKSRLGGRPDIEVTNSFHC